MSQDFSNIPLSSTLDVQPFKVHVDGSILDELNTLLKYAKFPRDTFENSTEDGTFGISKGWLEDTVEYWKEQFDWRKSEERINSYPHFKTSIKDEDGTAYDFHFVALFSKTPGALPIVFFHGWPGSFLEFLGILDLLRTKYTPETLPYHIIVPSLPGFAFSPLPALDRQFVATDVARLIHKMLIGLGFTRYVAQGGDIGSRIARILGSTYPECTAVHLNFVVLLKSDGFDTSNLSEKEQVGLARGDEFLTQGLGYAIMQGTRPSTIGAVLSSSPVALLAWIGEKFVSWSDDTPSLDVILESITLYWATNTFPGSIWHYRETDMPGSTEIHSNPQYYIKTYLGFSSFPKEILPTPRDWIATTGNLVHFSDHNKGGHFAALERPADLLKDVEDFIAVIGDAI